MEIPDMFEQLYLFKGKAYSLYKTGLPDSVVDCIDSLCMLFDAGPESSRRDMTSRVVPEVSYLFLRFSDNAALNSLRQRDEGLIVRGLEALAIENCKADWRDSTLRVPPLYRSAQKIGADPEKLIEAVAAIAFEPAKTQLFLSFLEKSPDNRKLEKFGLKEAIDPDGNVFYTSRSG